MHPHRKLLVLGLNELLARGLVTLEPSEDEARGSIKAEIAGRPSLVGWHDAGFQELRVDVWWGYNETQDNSRKMYGNGLPYKPLFSPPRVPRVIAASAGGWVERKTGRHLQGKGSQRLVGTYMRADARPILHALPDPVPAGFEAEGKLFL